MKLDQMLRSWNSVISYGLWYPVLEFVNDVQLIEHRFTCLEMRQIDTGTPIDRLCHLLLRVQRVHRQNDRSPTWFRAELWTKCRQEWISDTVWLDAVFCANWSRSLMLLIYYRSFQHCYDWSQLWSWLSTALMTTMSLTQSPFVTALWLNVWWVTACLSVCLSVTFHLTCFFSVCFHQILMQLDKNDVMAMGYEVTERILNICIN